MFRCGWEANTPLTAVVDTACLTSKAASHTRTNTRAHKTNQNTKGRGKAEQGRAGHGAHHGVNFAEIVFVCDWLVFAAAAFLRYGRTTACVLARITEFVKFSGACVVSRGGGHIFLLENYSTPELLEPCLVPTDCIDLWRWVKVTTTIIAL